MNYILVEIRGSAIKVLQRGADSVELYRERDRLNQAVLNEGKTLDNLRYAVRSADAVMTSAGVEFAA